MKAIILSKKGYLKYNDLRDLRIKKGWAKIRVMAAGLCGTDIQKILHDSTSRTSLKTHILGHEISGVVEDIQSNSTFKKEDRVAVIPIIYSIKGDITKSKSLGRDVAGGFSQFVLVPIKNLRKLPKNLSFELASLLDPLACAVHAYNLAGSPKNKTLLVVGDGTIALCTLILCKKFNNKVTLIGRNKANIKIAKDIGAKIIKNYMVWDKSKESFDCIFECVGRAQDESLKACICFVKHLSKIIVLGVFNKKYKNQLILRNLFFKEAMIIGSNCYTPNEFDDALKILSYDQPKFQKIITHILPLKDFIKGINLSKDRKKSKAIKIIFKPN